MRNLREKRNNVKSKEKVDEQVQPDLQKKEAPKSAVGYFTFRQKSQGLHQMHQNTC